MALCVLRLPQIIVSHDHACNSEGQSRVVYNEATNTIQVDDMLSPQEMVAAGVEAALEMVERRLGFTSSIPAPQST